MRCILKCSIAALVVLLTLSTPLRAQVLAGSGEVSANVGFNNLSSSVLKAYNATTSGLNKENVQFGFGGGYNLTKYIAIGGEYEYLPMFSPMAGYTGSMNSQAYGGAARFSLMSDGKFVPYVVAGGGGTHVSWTGANPTTANGNYFGVGGGVSIYLHHNFGIRGEYRWNHDSQTISELGNKSVTENVSSGAVAFFYQFGGKQSTKK